MSLFITLHNFLEKQSGSAHDLTISSPQHFKQIPAAGDLAAIVPEVVTKLFL